MEKFDAEVSIEANWLVKPEVPTQAHHLYLSSLDLFWREFPYNRRLLFYGLDDVDTQTLMVEKLKGSLSQVLVPFYPLAARLASLNGRACLECADQGVELVLATVPLHLHVFQATNFSPCAFFNKLAQFTTVDHSKLNELPLVSIQVTKFLCGGIAIGYAHSHVMADGHSMWHFMNTWAEVARGEPISLLPTHDRSFFQIDHPSPEIASQLNLPPICGPGQSSSNPLLDKEPLLENLFHVSPSMISSLKQQAGFPSTMPRGFSTFEAVCAHWWRHVMKARNLHDDDTVRFAVLADMRRRVTPPLPPSYFGNAIMFAFASSTFGELMGEDFGSVASRIYEASQECDEPRLHAKMHWLELHGNVFSDRLNWSGYSLNVASSPKFNVYGVDFGWGKPSAVRTSCIRGDGEIVLFSSPMGGIDACMALTKPAMQNLLEDSQFLPL